MSAPTSSTSSARASGARARPRSRPLRLPDAPEGAQVGGAELLTYREMMRRTAAVLERRPPIILKVPVPSPRLSSYWVSLVTPGRARARASAGRRPQVGDGGRAAAAPGPQRCPRFDAAVRAALR